jgi:hypothetical protein
VEQGRIGVKGTAIQRAGGPFAGFFALKQYRSIN